MKQVTIPKRSPGEHVFLSPTEPRLRSGWRLLIQTLLMVALIAILSISIGIVGLFVTIGQKVRDGLMQLVVLIAMPTCVPGNCG